VLLTESEIQRSLQRVQAAFPRFLHWDYNNEINDSYPGFSLWGEFVPAPNEPMPQSFFVTFDTDETTWRGHLSIGKPCYFWSSADYGDAYLVDTIPCATLEDAITGLQRRMADLFRALSGSDAEPGIAPDRSR
jgi:hypothetical protein